MLPKLPDYSLNRFAQPCANPAIVKTADLRMHLMMRMPVPRVIGVLPRGLAAVRADEATQTNPGLLNRAGTPLPAPPDAGPPEPGMLCEKGTTSEGAWGNSTVVAQADVSASAVNADNSPNKMVMTTAMLKSCSSASRPRAAPKSDHRVGDDCTGGTDREQARRGTPEPPAHRPQARRGTPEPPAHPPNTIPNPSERDQVREGSQSQRPSSPKKTKLELTRPRLRDDFPPSPPTGARFVWSPHWR